MTVAHPSRLSEGALAQTIDFDFSHMTNFASRRFTPLLTFFLLTTISALAEGTRTWEQSKYEDFLKGTPHGVAISSGGTLELAPGFKLTASTPSSAVWAVTTGARDEIFAATGSPARVYRITAHPPLGALEASGWRLVYNATPNWYQSLRERFTKTTDESFSIGMWIKQDGTIADVVYGAPAYAAGLMPGMKITAINGRKYAADVLREEISAKKSLDLSVEQGTFAGTFHVDDREGERFPHLERIAGAPDVLGDILRPRGERR